MLFLMLAVGGGGYLYLTIAPSRDDTPAYPSRNEFFRAASELLGKELNPKGYSIDILVTGHFTNEGTWSFRGSLKKNTRNLPFFGALRTTCEDWEDLSCWRLSSLAINGKESPLTDAAESTEVARQDENPASQQEAQETGSAASIEIPPLKSNDVADQTQETIEGSRQATPPGGESDSPPWFTTTDRVNARSGPGTQYERLYPMPSTVPLRLIEERDGWGRFTFQNANDSVSTVWIWMNLVRQR